MDSDLNEASPQFTLTCISTGGPATTVTWTRDSTTVITEGTETVLNDPVAAQYTHTLIVTGRWPGHYKCTVENNKPSTNSKTYVVHGTIICSYRVTIFIIIIMLSQLLQYPIYISWLEKTPLVSI